MSSKGFGIGRAIAFACAATLSFVIPASAIAHHGGPEHLPAVQQNMDLVGELELSGEFGDVSPGQIADLAVYKGYAYLNSWDEPSCERGGTFVADISNPANPQEVNFIPASGDGYYHGEGAHVITIDTLGVTRDMLAVNNEACTNAANRPPGVDPLSGGFDLYDVTDPLNPVTLVQNAGDDEVATPANSYHSVFIWQDGPNAYLVASDNTELEDVDIFDITDPEAPVQVADIDVLTEFPEVEDPQAPHGNTIFHHDVVVKEIGGVMRMLVSNWDSGYVQLNVDDPANPTYITDTDFPAVDPLVPGFSPEGNAHQADYSFDGQYFVAGDEDFGAFRLTNTITEAPFDGVEFTAAVSDAEPIPDGTTVGGDTVFVGAACTGTVDPPPAGVTVAVAERGVCAGGFQEKIDAIEDAGYDLGVIFNNTFGAAQRCEGLINMLVDPATTAMPAVFVGRADAFRILGTFDQATYQCTGGLTEEPDDTDPPPVGTGGLTIEIASEFDGWGYAHLYDANTSAEIDAFAIPEALDPAFAAGFGDLSIHEFATDPQTNLAYSSYYAGGVRVFQFGAAGLNPTGAYIDPDGSNFWGIEQFTPAARRASDRGL